MGLSMAQTPPPNGFTSWNDYIEQAADASLDQSITARRLIKRDIKLGMIAVAQRLTDNRYAARNTYVSPGTRSPSIGHPWTSTVSQISSEASVVITSEAAVPLTV